MFVQNLTLMLVTPFPFISTIISFGLEVIVIQPWILFFFSIDEKTLSVSVSFEVNFRSVEAQIILTNHNDCCYVSGLKLNI